MRRILFRTLFVIALTITILPAALMSAKAADDTSFAASDFFLDGVSARSFGMGNAFVAVCDDTSAAYWNPAGLGLLKNYDFSTTRSTLPDIGLAVQSVSMAAPIGKGALGFNLVYSAIGDAPKNVQDETTGRLSFIGLAEESNLAYSLSYALPMGTKSYLGATVKNARQKLDNMSASGWGLDIGAVADYPHYRLGAVLQNVGDLKIGTDIAPFNLRLGAMTRYLDDKLTLAASYDSKYLNDSFYSLGAEYTIAQNFSARIGTSNSIFSSGIGVNYESFRFDYAFNNNKTFGDQHKITVNYGIPVAKKKKPAPKQSEKTSKPPETAKSVKKDTSEDETAVKPKKETPKKETAKKETEKTETLKEVSKPPEKMQRIDRKKTLDNTGEEWRERPKQPDDSETGDRPQYKYKQKQKKNSNEDFIYQSPTGSGKSQGGGSQEAPEGGYSIDYE